MPGAVICRSPQSDNQQHSLSPHRQALVIISVHSWRLGHQARISSQRQWRGSGRVVTLVTCSPQLWRNAGPRPGTGDPLLFPAATARDPTIRQAAPRLSQPPTVATAWTRKVLSLHHRPYTMPGLMSCCHYPLSLLTPIVWSETKHGPL